MAHTKQMSQALGQAAKNSVKRHEPAKPTDRQISERTYLAIKNTIEDSDRWSQSEIRDVLTFKDTNDVIWYLSIANKYGRLQLVLVNGGNGSNLGWMSKTLMVGWPIEKENGRVGFALTVDFAGFAQWRREVQRDRPETRPSAKSN